MDQNSKQFKEAKAILEALELLTGQGNQLGAIKLLMDKLSDVRDDSYADGVANGREAGYHDATFGHLDI